jgi:outer membrane protein OmpA-like peptidoglycan-associated protein
VRIENGMLRILQPVFFANNRDTVLARSNRVLNAVVEALQASPEIQHVSIEGHTDDAGDDARNLDLSQRRATSVMAWLVRHGIAANRLEAHGFGETHPIAPNTDATGRAQNRRVEFRIVDPNAPSAGPATQ